MLLDQGNLTAAIDTLKRLAKDTAKRDPAEHNEVRGLLGREYQQIFVDPGGAHGKWVPIVDTCRTICIAPPPEVKAVFEAICEFGSAA